VCDLITNRVDVRVIEQRGERDITRDILLQVFAVQEQGDAPRLTQQFLTDLIRSYGAQTSDDLSLLLERSLDRILAIDGGQAIADHN
jgi:polyhydroxyalkanoate synthesis regulator protein